MAFDILEAVLAVGGGVQVATEKLGQTQTALPMKGRQAESWKGKREGVTALQG